MEIQEHIIKDSEIVGMSPLMRTEYPDQVIRMMYKRFQWSFDIYLKQNTITIKSNWLDFDGADKEQIKKAEQARQDFKLDFDKARENIQSLIKQ